MILYLISKNYHIIVIQKYPFQGTMLLSGDTEAVTIKNVCFLYNVYKGGRVKPSQVPQLTW